MATAASSQARRVPRRRVPAVGALAALAAFAVLAVAGCGSSGSSASSASGTSGRVPSISPPAGWHTVKTAAGDSTLAYPPGWAAGQSDAGSVSAYLGLSAADIPRGYLNVTPQQGDESLKGWSAFRLSHNRDEGDRNVTLISSVDRRRIGAATASCVNDVYMARVGTHRWHELACFVQGPRSGSVFVGAAQPKDWPALQPVIERSLAALEQR